MVGNQAKKNRVDRERKLHRVREKVFAKNEKVIIIKLKLLTSVKTDNFIYTFPFFVLLLPRIT